MPELSFASELSRYGPDSPAGAVPSLAEAQDYCRRLARGHYENFAVASWLLPRRLRQHFYNVYAYCRWADDLADETATPEESEKLLDWWEVELQDCYRGEARHPVFVALRETIERFSIPSEPFADLLVAFRQDQRVTRYQTFEQLLEYCRHSANPVGRLVLYLVEAHDERRGELSDSICTGLQLANFWQDVARDWQRGRLYLPQETLDQCGYTAEMLVDRRYNLAFRQALAIEVDRAGGYLDRGGMLAELVPREIQVDIALFSAGGRAVLDSIRRIDYNVWDRRPTVSKPRQLWLLVRCWWRAFVGGNREGPA